MQIATAAPQIHLKSCALATFFAESIAARSIAFRGGVLHFRVRRLGLCLGRHAYGFHRAAGRFRLRQIAREMVVPKVRADRAQETAPAARLL